ncbi:MAG: hypothetical protein QFB86_01345 [Patescibacteria group bacterium]|nr:hypothetical protein [Patescibacteria group bacterium]
MLGLVVMLPIIGFTGGAASAHVLKQNGNISGVLHVPPTDEPAAGVDTTLYVAFADKSHAFNLTDCECELHIEQNGKNIHEEPIKPQLAGSTLTSQNMFNFPAIGSYVIEVHGHAKNGQFSDFGLAYTVRVTTDSRSSAPVARNQNTTAIGIISIGVLAGIGVFGVAGARDSGRYRKSPNKV